MTLDIRGIEYDWLACDEHGHVALLSTAGGGRAPRLVIEDTSAQDAAIELLLAERKLCAPRFAPDLDETFVNTWKLMAMRGIFAFDSDAHGGPYRLVAAPTEPRLALQLPYLVRRVASRIVIPRTEFAALAAGEVLVCWSGDGR